MADSLLYLKEFRCVAETDEGGNDSPYFLVFIGNRHHPKSMSVQRVRMPEWDEKAFTGKLFQPHLYISNAVRTDTVVLVTMLEEDWDPDFEGATLLQALMLAHWTVYTGPDWSNLTVNQLAAIMRDRMATLVRDMLANDEYLKTLQLPISVSVGELPLLKFAGDLGRYNVRFEMKSTQA